MVNMTLLFAKAVFTNKDSKNSAHAILRLVSEQRLVLVGIVSMPDDTSKLNKLLVFSNDISGVVMAVTTKATLDIDMYCIGKNPRALPENSKVWWISRGLDVLTTPEYRGTGAYPKPRIIIDEIKGGSR